MAISTLSRILAGNWFTRQVPASKGTGPNEAPLRCIGSIRVLIVMGCCAANLLAQQPASTPSTQLPDAPSASIISGTVTDTDEAYIAGAHISLEDLETKSTLTTQSDATGSFSFPNVAPGRYLVRISAAGFASWKVEDVVIRAGESFVLPPILLGVESISSTVDAITQEDLAEQQISDEVKQRIIGVLPNFYVSYIPNAAPLTRKQKFKLALKVSVDPVTFMTTGITAGIEQAQNDFSGYGGGFEGYSKRYGATYGTRVTSTILGAAAFPSLFHQDPRYFYKGKGKIINRALYAISTVVICKGDNGHWQPNYSNVLGNLAAGGISSFYYPDSDRHDVQVTVDNILIGVGTGAIGTLFQEFLLKHLTHGVPPAPPPPVSSAPPARPAHN
jgi:Carboxypeptidase regulatory-like domain